MEETENQLLAEIANENNPPDENFYQKLVGLISTLENSISDNNDQSNFGQYLKFLNNFPFLCEKMINKLNRLNLNDIILDFLGICNKILGYMRDENISLDRVEEIDTNMVNLGLVLIKSFKLDDPSEFKQGENEEKMYFASLDNLNLTMNTSITNLSMDKGNDDVVIQDLSIDIEKDLERESMHNSIKGSAMRTNIENLVKMITRLSNFVSRVVLKELRPEKIRNRSKMKRCFSILHHYLTFKEFRKKLKQYSREECRVCNEQFIETSKNLKVHSEEYLENCRGIFTKYKDNFSFEIEFLKNTVFPISSMGEYLFIKVYSIYAAKIFSTFFSGKKSFDGFFKMALDFIEILQNFFGNMCKILQISDEERFKQQFKANLLKFSEKGLKIVEEKIVFSYFSNIIDNYVNDLLNHTLLKHLEMLENYSKLTIKPRKDGSQSKKGLLKEREAKEFKVDRKKIPEYETVIDEIDFYNDNLFKDHQSGAQESTNNHEAIAGLSNQVSLFSNTNIMPNSLNMNLKSSSIKSSDDLDDLSFKASKKLDFSGKNKHFKSAKNLKNIESTVQNNTVLIYNPRTMDLGEVKELTPEDVSPEWFSRKYKTFQYLTKQAPRKISTQGFELMQLIDLFVIKLKDWQSRSSYEDVFVNKLFNCLLECFKGFPAKLSRMVRTLNKMILVSKKNFVSSKLYLTILADVSMIKMRLKQYSCIFRDNECRSILKLIIDELEKEIDKLCSKLSTQYQLDIYSFSLSNISIQSWSHFHPYTLIKTPTMSVQHLLNYINGNSSAKKTTLSNFSPSHIFISAGLTHWQMKMDKLLELFEQYFFNQMNRDSFPIYLNTSVFSIENIFLKYWVIKPSRTRAHQFASDSKFIAVCSKLMLEEVLYGFLSVFNDVYFGEKLGDTTFLETISINIFKMWIMVKHLALISFLLCDHYTEICRFLTKIASGNCNIASHSFFSDDESVVNKEEKVIEIMKKSSSLNQTDETNIQRIQRDLAGLLMTKLGIFMCRDVKEGKHENSDKISEFLLWSNLTFFNETIKTVFFDANENSIAKVKSNLAKLEEEIKTLAENSFQVGILEEFNIFSRPSYSFPESSSNKMLPKSKRSSMKTYLNILSSLEIKNKADELADIKEICFDDLEMSIPDIISVLRKRPELINEEYPPLSEGEILAKQELETHLAKLSDL